MKIVIHCTTGFAGSDSWDFVEVEDNLTTEELDSLAYEYALNNADTYGYYPPNDEMSDEELEDTNVSDSIEGTWYPYIAEKHDMYSMNSTPTWNPCY